VLDEKFNDQDGTYQNNQVIAVRTNVEGKINETLHLFIFVERFMCLSSK
jgi:hypothetical protein